MFVDLIICRLCREINRKTRGKPSNPGRLHYIRGSYTVGDLEGLLLANPNVFLGLRIIDIAATTLGGYDSYPLVI
ncbi:hypothetical protein ACTXT7_014099 [Hymenolepis weldensis]